MRIRAGFALPELDTPLVKKNEARYAANADYVRRMTERSQLYLFHIVEEVERRKLPSEIALLPMIESAFNPQAYSRSHASGIWQFIPSTGKHFGLDQNWWYDGRRNVIAATNAALDYLEQLYAMFGSWDLALAAYNCGEGCVSRAIVANQMRGLSTDYLSLPLPLETRNYVPKLFAVRNVIADPDAYGIKLNDVPNKPFFTIVEIKKHIDVALAARFADMSLQEFAALNPAFNKTIITRNDHERLLLPTTKVDVFNANMQRYGDQQLHSWQAYRGQRGESVDKIAAKHGLSPRELRSLNNVQEKRGKLKTAQLLLVPLHLAKPLPTAAQIATTQVKSAPAVGDPSLPQTYVVRKGDTLYALARRFGTSVEALTEHNHLDGAALKVGETMEIPAAVLVVVAHEVAADGDNEEGGARPVRVTAEAAASHPPTSAASRTARPAPAAKSSLYTVKRGDTLYSIAKAFKVTVAELARWNNLTTKSKLRPGAKMRILPVTR